MKFTSQKSNANPKLIAYIFTPIGVVCASIAVWLLLSTITFLQTADSTTGTVVDYITSTSDGDTMYSPVYEYHVAGETYRGGTNGSTSWRPTMGTQKEIYYDPNDPEDIKVNSFMGMWFAPIFLSVFGFIIGGAGILFWRTNKRIAQIKLRGQTTTTTDWKITGGGRNSGLTITAGFDYNGQRHATMGQWLSAKQSVLLKDEQPVTIKFLPEDPNQSVVDLGVLS